MMLVEHGEDPGSDVPDAARLVLRTLVEALRFLWQMAPLPTPQRLCPVP